MTQKANPEDLRDMLRLSRQLRASAAGTDDCSYLDLFLRTASALEERASRLAFGEAEDANFDCTIVVQGHVDLLC